MFAQESPHATATTCEDAVPPNAPAPALAKGEIRFYPRYVCSIHKRCLTQPAFALRSFRSQ